jgi:hypothetical protein
MDANLHTIDLFAGELSKTWPYLSLSVAKLRYKKVYQKHSLHSRPERTLVFFKS